MHQDRDTQPGPTNTQVAYTYTQSPAWLDGEPAKGDAVLMGAMRG